MADKNWDSTSGPCLSYTNLPVPASIEHLSPQIVPIIKMYKDLRDGHSFPAEFMVSSTLNRQVYNELQRILKKEGLLDELRDGSCAIAR